MKVNSILITLFSLACFAGGQLANAATHVWSGAQNGLWSNPANWSSGGVPGAIEPAPVVIMFPYDASARRMTTNNINNLKVDVLAFYGGNYEMYGDDTTLTTLTLRGGQPPFPYTGNLNSGGSTNNLIDASVTMVLSNNVTVMVATNATLELQAWLTGSGGFTKTGAGELWLHGWSNHNNYQGPTTVLDGIVASEARYYYGWDWEGTPMVTISGDLIIGDTNMTRNPKVQMFDGWLGSKPLTINPNGTMELYYGAIASSLTLTGGKLRFMPNVYWDDYDGWLTNYSSFYCISNLTAVPTRLGTAAIQGPGTFHFYNTNSGAQSFINVQADKLIMDADLRGNPPVHKIGPGEWIWNGSDDYVNGDFLIEQGLLVVSGYFPFLYDSVTVSNGAQITVRGACGSSSDFHLNGFGLGGTNGALVIEHDGAQFAASMYFDSDTAIIVTNAAHTFTVIGDYYATYQHFQGPGHLFKRGPGTLKITGDQTNSMTGNFYVEEGMLVLDNQEGIAAVSTPLVIGRTPAGGTTAEVRLLKNNQMPVPVPVTINDSGTLNLYGFNETIGPLTLRGGDIKTYGGLLTLTGDVLATNGLGSIISGKMSLGSAKRAFHIASGYNINIQASVSDNSTIVGFDKLGAGSLTLSGSNTFFGIANVLEGLLYARNDHALGNTSMYTIVANGARLAVDGRNLGTEGLILSGDGGGYGALSCGGAGNVCNGVINLYADSTINVAGPNDRLVLGGLINGPGGILKIGAGTLAFTGNSGNAYTGLTTVSEGGLELAKTNQLAVPWGLVIGEDVSPAGSAIVHVLRPDQIGHFAPVTIGGSGVLDMSGVLSGQQTIGSLAGLGPLKLGANTLTLGGNNLDTSYLGTITGTAASSLGKAGAGRWTLNGTSDQFLGTTTIYVGSVRAGIYMPNSKVTLKPSTALLGDGTFSVVTSTGGTIHHDTLGYHPMTLKNLSLDSFSTLKVELVGPQANGFSRLNVGGTVSLGGAKLDVALKFVSTIGTKFQIITNDGIDDVIGTFKDLGEGATFVRGTAKLQITYTGGNGNDVVLTHIGNVAPPHVDSIETLGNGHKVIRGTGWPGLTYTVEASTDLKTWTAIGTATAEDPSGKIWFVDPDAPNFPHRFYRFLAP